MKKLTFIFALALGISAANAMDTKGCKKTCDPGQTVVCTVNGDKCTCECE